MYISGDTLLDQNWPLVAFFSTYLVLSKVWSDSQCGPGYSGILFYCQFQIGQNHTIYSDLHNVILICY